MNNRQRRCYELVREQVQPGSSVLEISCGKGPILARLQADGYRVCGTNFSRYDDSPEGVDIRAGVSVMDGLPFGDGAFDAVILCDVIEHLADHVKTIREVARVTRHGGAVVILSPNTNKIGSRLHYLFSGFFKIKRAFIGFDVPLDKAFTFHNHPPHLPFYLYLTQACSLELTGLDAVEIKPKSVLMWMALAPLILLGTWFTTGVKERNIRGRDSGRQILRTLTSFKALCGESWAAVHRKTATGGAAPDATAATPLPEWHRTAATASGQ